MTADALEDGGGWRLTLAFWTDEKRLDGRLPAAIGTDTPFGEAVSDVAAALLTPEAYAE